MLVISDRMDQLPEERLALLQQAYELLGGSARVVDLFAHDPPELVRCEYDDGEVIGVFNFGSRPAERTVEIDRPVGGDSVRELWSGAELPLRDGRVVLGPIPAHGCRLLWCEPAAPVVAPE
jgi:hypothetical protein